ncbi:MAG: helix-turn-helix domain-containing protein [Mycobacterium sp.]
MTAPATAEGVSEHPPGLTGVNTARRRWAKSDATQLRILDAAAAVFREHGYAAATIGDVVTTSGASIGSIYHHFGGKSELFLAIHERLRAAVGQRIADSGHLTTSASFRESLDAQARRYLEAIWTHRHIAAIMATDDVPPGYERIRRDSLQAWFQRWLTELEINASAAAALLTRVLIAVLTESAAQVMTCDDADEAGAVTDAALTHLNRLLD